MMVYRLLDPDWLNCFTLFGYTQIISLIQMHCIHEFQHIMTNSFIVPESRLLIAPTAHWDSELWSDFLNTVLVYPGTMNKDCLIWFWLMRDYGGRHSKRSGF